jgi:hypothetical protein
MSATTLYGNEWYGDVNPTTGVLPGQSWVQPTSGTVWRRNTSNTAWVPFGNVNSSLGGALNGGGDTATGPLLDLPNLAPINNPAFTGTMLLNGIAVALQTDLSAQQKSLYDDIVNGVSQQFLSQYQQSTTAANIAYYSSMATVTQNQMVYGNSGFTGLAIPLPTFLSDSLPATQGQLVGYGWSVVGQSFGVGGTSGIAKVIEISPSTGAASPGSRFLGYVASSTGNITTLEILLWSFATR